MHASVCVYLNKNEYTWIEMQEKCSQLKQNHKVITLCFSLGYRKMNTSRFPEGSTEKGL